jgi:hypothetical protein
VLLWRHAPIEFLRLGAFHPIHVCFNHDFHGRIMCYMFLCGWVGLNHLGTHHKPIPHTPIPQIEGSEIDLFIYFFILSIAIYLSMYICKYSDISI